MKVFTQPGVVSADSTIHMLPRIFQPIKNGKTTSNIKEVRDLSLSAFSQLNFAIFSYWLFLSSSFSASESRESVNDPLHECPIKCKTRNPTRVKFEIIIQRFIGWGHALNTDGS